MADVTVITNHVPRPIVEAWELTEVERGEFDYLDWQALERGEDSRQFVRYRGVTYDLSDTEGRPPQDVWRGWDAIVTDSFFSGVLFKFTADCEYVVCARYYAS